MFQTLWQIRPRVRGGDLGAILRLSELEQFFAERGGGDWLEMGVQTKVSNWGGPGAELQVLMTLKGLRTFEIPGAFTHDCGEQQEKKRA